MCVLAQMAIHAANRAGEPLASSGSGAVAPIGFVVRFVQLVHRYVRDPDVRLRTALPLTVT
jgi:hypothetical protein